MTAECSEGSCAVHACAANLPTYWKIYSGVVLRMNPATFSLAWLTRLKTLSDGCAKFSTIMSILWMRFSKSQSPFRRMDPIQTGKGRELRKKGPEEFVFLHPLGLRGTVSKDRYLRTYLSLSAIRERALKPLWILFWLLSENKMITHWVGLPEQSGVRDRCFKIAFAGRTVWAHCLQVVVALSTAKMSLPWYPTAACIQPNTRSFLERSCLSQVFEKVKQSLVSPSKIQADEALQVMLPTLCVITRQ